MKRRNLSGVFIFEKFDDEPKEQPTVFEDCKEETQDKWLDSLEESALKKLCKQLAQCIRELGEHFDIVTQEE